MKIRGPRHGLKVGQLADVRSIQPHGKHIGHQTLFIKSAPDDAVAIRCEEGSAIITWRVGESSGMAPIRVHEIDFPKVGGVDVVALTLLFRELGQGEGVTERTKNDPLPIRRIGSFRIVARGVCETLQIRSIAL